VVRGETIKGSYRDPRRVREASTALWSLYKGKGMNSASSTKGVSQRVSASGWGASTRRSKQSGGDRIGGIGKGLVLQSEGIGSPKEGLMLRELSQQKGKGGGRSDEKRCIWELS